jgi:hypothetical protein
MTRQRKILLATVVVAALAAVAVSLEIFARRVRHPATSITLTGDVIKNDVDPAQQTPISGVIVTASAGSANVTARSNPSGLFSIVWNPGRKTDEQVTLTFAHAGYKTLNMIATRPGDQVYIARMEPTHAEPDATPKQAQSPSKTVVINSVRVRYTLTQQSTVDVGSLAKQFVAYNVGNIPCRGRKPCSPDGRWAARETVLPLDAEQGNEFRNVRILCVAGPCAFTQIESNSFLHPARRILVSVLNWSDQTDFLVEADVTRIMATDSVQYAYPFIVGQTMNFGLPPGSEGASAEADLDGQYILFPFGPRLILSWANCSTERSQSGNQIYRCQLKPGYRFAG